MNKNNMMYNMFKEMKKAYAENNRDVIEQCARCWMQQDPDNPFPPESPAHEEFFQMKKCYTIWSRGDIDKKINVRRMVDHAIALCKLNPKQPYTFDKKADEEEKKQRAEEEKAAQLKAEEKARQIERDAFDKEQAEKNKIEQDKIATEEIKRQILEEETQEEPEEETPEKVYVFNVVEDKPKTNLFKRIFKR